MKSETADSMTSDQGETTVVMPEKYETSGGETIPNPRPISVPTVESKTVSIKTN